MIIINQMPWWERYRGHLEKQPRRRVVGLKLGKGYYLLGFQIGSNRQV